VPLERIQRRAAVRGGGIVSKPMRIRLDRTVCDGFGVCAKHAPEYFSLDDWGYASLIGDGTVPEADRAAVMRALMDCPVHAIIAIGEHQPSGQTRPASHSEQPPEPHVENEVSEAISEFVR
jgi:ferredoxin